MSCVINFILDRFRDMGATEEEIAAEKKLLENDRQYMADWYYTVGP